MYYKNDELELIATKLNEKYFPNRLNNLEPIDLYEFMEMLSIDYEWKYITPDDSILGIIFFEDGYWPVWPIGKYKKGDYPKKELFKKGTIVINQVLLDKKKVEKENFVVCHEIMHYIKDQEFFKKEGGGVLQICSRNSFEKTSWNYGMDSLEVVERQTNYLTAAFMMSKDALIKEFFRIGRYKHIPTQSVEYKSYMRGWVSQIAKELKLNFNPVLYRLYDLKILKRDNT